MGKDRFQKMTVILVLLSGFFAGVLTPELFRMGRGNYAGFASLYSFRKYETMAVSWKKILPCILSVRIRTLLFLWMSSFTTAGLLFHLIYGWWLAASAGMLIALFMLREGYGGILLFLCCLFPQWIWYAAMWRKELGFLFQKRHYDFAVQTQAQPLRRRDMAELGKMMGLCLAGCAAEAFLGRWTLKIFLQYFT